MCVNRVGDGDENPLDWFYWKILRWQVNKKYQHQFCILFLINGYPHLHKFLYMSFFANDQSFIKSIVIFPVLDKKVLWPLWLMNKDWFSRFLITCSCQKIYVLTLFHSFCLVWILDQFFSSLLRTLYFINIYFCHMVS